MSSLSQYLSPAALLRVTFGAWQRPALLGVAALFVAFLLVDYGARAAGLALVGGAMGVVFHKCQFGFASTWRALILRGDGRGLRAQMLWIALAALPFALLTGAGDVFTAQASANVRPLSLAVAVGAFIFGIGIQMGGACTSGSIVGAGGGDSVPMVSIVCFVIGAIFAASHIEMWSDLPAFEAFSFYHEWGLAGAAALIAVAGGVAGATLLLPQKTVAPAAATASPPPANQTQRMSLYRGAVYIAFLSVLILVLAEQPWGFINGLTVAGGKALIAAGYDDISFWDFWSRLGNGEELLYGGWFAASQVVTAAGMLLGVALAAAFTVGIKNPLRNVTAKRLAFSSFGGVIMGYGAQISYGCNIGSYVSALSSGSAHGWLWLVFAFAGAAVGVGIRKIGGLPQ